MKDVAGVRAGRRSAAGVAGRRQRSRTVLVALLLAAGGVGLVLQALAPAPEAPLPSSPVTASPGQIPTGPETAVIAGTEFTAADMAPAHLFIPEIGAYAPISDNGVNGGELSIPKDPRTLTRWADSAALGAPTGNTLIAGHVTNGKTRGALFSLADLRAGHRAYVTDEAGAVYQFQLESLTAVVKAALPEEVWDQSGARRVTVVTCGGPVIETRDGRHYRDNVIAVFVEESK